MNISNKSTYLLVVSAIALTSCSQEDLPGLAVNGGSQILFSTSIPVTTRATVTTKDNMSHFFVTAFDFDDPDRIKNGVVEPLFEYRKVEIDPEHETYVSSDCCWPEATKESDLVNFFGFYPAPADPQDYQFVNSSADGSLSYKLKSFSVAPDIADQVDFITAYTTGSMEKNLFSGVTLPFEHKLSRIEVKAYGKNNSCDIEIAGVRIGGTGVSDTFEFKAVEGGGVWTGNPSRGVVEYVFRKGDKIVSCGKNNKVAYDDAFSIMGAERADGNENCAMLIPANYAEWDYEEDTKNTANQMYISVLLRVTDPTPTAGENPKEKQRYPYRDLSQGANAMDSGIPVVYLAIDKATGEVSTRLYKKDEIFYTDSSCTSAYTLPASEEIKEFGWAAVPVKGEWLPGKIYTYTLDYTLGVGVHEPGVTTVAPGAGDPVISDRVGLTYDVKEWKVGGSDNFPVPGS